jgi:hypothetical protein
MNNTRRSLELHQELHQLLDNNLNSDSVTRYYEIKSELAELARNTTFKPFFTYPIGA